MNAEFRRIQPECIDFLPADALEMIRSAIDRTPSDLNSVADTLERMRQSIGELYVILAEQKLTGILYLVQVGRILNIALLGGEGIGGIRQGIRQFIYDAMLNSGCHRLCVIGREGWGKMFPELQYGGTLFVSDPERIRSYLQSS